MKVTDGGSPALRHTRRSLARMCYAGLRILFFPLLLVPAAPLMADADISVRVFQRGGNEPLAGASVCLGTPARISQFGSSVTDAAGNARFTSVPRAPLVVTVSRPGYKGEQQSLVVSGTGRTLVISLATGGGGPGCEHEGQAADAFSGGLHVADFRLARRERAAGGRQVVLLHSVNREPTHYRVSENPDFSGAGWQTYTSEPVYQLSSGSGHKVVYFQVRRHSDMSGTEVERRSPIVQDAILVQ
jgi:hypothetical protein